MSQLDGRFEPGQEPWNKGLKGIHLSPKSEWKKGVYNPTSRNKSNRVDKECLGCKKHFSTRASWTHVKCCSKKCSVAYRKTLNRPGPNSGNRASQATREKQRKAKLGIRGPQHWNWKGAARAERKRAMGRDEYKQWRLAVFKRDGFACVECGDSKSYLYAHHVSPWAKSPDLRYDLGNGVTLCEACHKAKHPELSHLFTNNERARRMRKSQII